MDKFTDAPIGSTSTATKADGWGNMLVETRKNGKVAWRKLASKSADGKDYGIRLDESVPLHKALLKKSDNLGDGEFIELTVRLQVIRTPDSNDEDDDEIEIL